MPIVLSFSTFLTYSAKSDLFLFSIVWYWKLVLCYTLAKPVFIILSKFSITVCNKWFKKFTVYFISFDKRPRRCVCEMVLLRITSPLTNLALLFRPNNIGIYLSSNRDSSSFLARARLNISFLNSKYLIWTVSGMNRSKIHFHWSIPTFDSVFNA